jgi:transcriptional regulator with XRE-family HTH domain
MPNLRRRLVRLNPLLAAKTLQANTKLFRHVLTGTGVGVLAAESNASPTRRKAVELSAFFERLRMMLDDRGMTQADLARELGVGVGTVSEWFTRGRVPSGDVMLRLPQTLEVNGHWLLTGEGPRELGWEDGDDPYVRGARDALAQMNRCLAEVARRFPDALHPDGPIP